MKMRKKLFHSRRVLENLAVTFFGVGMYLCFTHFDVVSAYISGFLRILRPFIAAFVLAFLLNRPVTFFEKKVYHRLKKPRPLSILTVWLLAAGVLGALAVLVVPHLITSVVAIVNNLSSYAANISQLAIRLQETYHLDPQVIEPFLFTSADIATQATTLLTDFMPHLLDISVSLGSSVSGILVDAFTALIASVYMLSGKNTLLRQFRKLVFACWPQEKALRILTVCARANNIFSGFIIGKLIDSAIIGIICWLGMTLLRMPYVELISIIIGITNVVPYFGPFIGAIPSILILFIVSPIEAVKFTVFVLVLQQFDGNILGPKILGESTGLSAIWVLVAIIVGGGLFGFAGMVLGVPTFSVIYTLFSEYISRRLQEKGLDSSGKPLPQPEKEATK